MKSKFVLLYVTNPHGGGISSRVGQTFFSNERFVLYVHFRSLKMNVSFISVKSGPKVPKNDQKKGLFGVKSGSKMAKNSKMNGNERKK